jgi:hypothetical protein
MGVELHEMRAKPQVAGEGKRRSGRAWLSSGIGGPASGASTASLHSKVVIIDRRLSAIGAMNLDLRSQHLPHLARTQLREHLHHRRARNEVGRDDQHLLRGLLHQAKQAVNDRLTGDDLVVIGADLARLIGKKQRGRPEVGAAQVATAGDAPGVVREKELVVHDGARGEHVQVDEVACLARSAARRPPRC